MTEHFRSSLAIISTAHITPDTADHLNAETDMNQLPFNGAPTPWGWLMYVERDERPKDMPDDLWSVCQWAQSVGSEYVLFDCDASTIDGLPTYDW